ncbi:MAG TPA: glycosyltransferase family 4 protein [Caldilineaceae bacterium]|nr:glycosyltransferase family 4 protein [Caldilineaceae bacterium]
MHITPAFQHPLVSSSHRHYHLIRELSQRHSITWLTLQRAAIANNVLQEMASYTEHIIAVPVNGAIAPYLPSVLQRLPGAGGKIGQQLAVQAAVAKMREQFLHLMKSSAFDVVLFHGRDCAALIDDLRGLPVVVDFSDVASLRIRSKLRYVSPTRALLLAMRYLQVRNIERRLARSTPHLAFMSLQDREAVLGPSARADVIPNGIDLSYWSRRSWNPRRNSLIFIGNMNRRSDADAAVRLIDHILPRLRPQVPDLELVLAGREPAPELLRRAAAHPEVVVTCTVEDVRDYLEQATLFVAPLRYILGMPGKLQEALAMEVPIVTTSVAAEGLRVERGEDLPICVADSFDAFARRIVELLRQPTERERMARQGRRFAERHFSWRRNAEQFERMCINALAGRNGSPRAN